MIERYVVRWIYEDDATGRYHNVWAENLRDALREGLLAYDREAASHDMRTVTFIVEKTPPGKMPRFT